MPSETKDGGGRESRLAPLLPYTEIFNKSFPYYLAIGMTYDQYWNEDCTLVKYYRQADRIKRERKNQDAWLQGMYIYDAMLRVSPILRAFAKQGTKPEPYVEEAYPISSVAVKERNEKKERENSEKALRYMQAFMVANNKRFEKKEETECQ